MTRKTITVNIRDLPDEVYAVILEAALVKRIREVAKVKRTMTEARAIARAFVKKELKRRRRGK
jgi:hypothetical protein